MAEHAILYIIDGLNGAGDVLDTFQSLIWNVQFFGNSEFELVVAGTPKNVQRLEVGKYLVRDVDISENEFNNVMMIESKELEFNVEEGWTLTVKGSGLKKIVGQRVIWQQTNLTGTVENGIRYVINENIINPEDANRAIPNFMLGVAQGFTDEFDVQLLGENLADWISSTCQTYGYGWDVSIKNNKYVFNLKRGTDRTYDQSENIPVVFSPEYDNLISSIYTYEQTEYKNAGLVGGEGEGTAQRFSHVGSTAGLERFETYIDGTSVSSNGEIITLETYMKMLQDFGATELAKTAYTEKFEGSVIPNGMYNYGEDYFLGDLVQIENENGISASTRIIELIYSEDENGWALTPTFGAWEDDEESEG